MISLIFSCPWIPLPAPAKPGTIIELERIAGEPIDVLVNGKFVARGEVVVIEESFGIRVTEIIK